MMNTFSLRLTGFLMDSHPDRIEDTGFIRERGQQAARTFERCSRQGMTVDEAMQQANEVLYRGLHFSPYLMMTDILAEQFGRDQEDEETAAFALRLLDDTHEIITAYAPDDAFEGSTRYPELYLELTGFIHEYLNDHGIQ